MRYKFNPPPNWPTPPAGFRPGPDWKPSPEWGPLPDGWQLWVPVVDEKLPTLIKKKSVWSHPVMITTYVMAPLAALVLFVGITAPVTTTAANPSSTVAGTNDPAPSTSYSRTPTSEPTAKPTKTKDPEPTKTKKPKPKPTIYKELTPRKWKKIAKNPDAYIGQTYVVYGQVTQFDSATGPDSFLAMVGGVRDSCAYGYCDYPTNTMLTGDEWRLEKLVEDDVFRAKVIVMGSMDYETQIGGETTVPALIVDRVKLLD